MTAEELLQANHISVPNIAPGRYYTTCPQCSAKRSKEHQGNKVLGVTIEADGALHWGCNHCSWTGPPKGSGQASADTQTFYDYRDTARVVRFRKVRNPPGRNPKFYMQRPDGSGGWFNGVKGIDTSVLYRVDEVAKAIESGAVVCIVEGEKDADRLWSLGIAATCNAHGASEPGKQLKWTKAHSEQLKGADIVVLNDNDAAGYAHADAAAKLSLGIAKRVRRLDLAKHWPDMPKGNDVSDWLDGGHSGQKLVELVDSAPDFVLSKDEAQSQAQSEPADAEIMRLAKLSTVQYEQERKGAAEKLNVRASILDRLVQAERDKLGFNADDGKQGHAISFPEPEPWPEPVDGAALLDGLAVAIRKHVMLADHARDAAALWSVHTYLLDCFLVSPRLGVRSPTKGCGKTLLLDVLGRLVLRPLPAANVTSSAIFRVIEGHRPTLLVDEADTFLYDNDELRGVLNSGHRKGGSVLRTVGDDFEPRAFATFSACAIALIGSLPDTLHDRAVVIDLKRRMPSETIEPFRPDRAGYLDVLARKAARWAQDHADKVATADPNMPSGIINRKADNWRPVLAIADAAGGDWPDRARKAAMQSYIEAEDDDASRLELLLGDIRDVFTEKGLDEIASVDLVKALIAIEGRPWAELGKSRKPLTQNRLARLLKPLPVIPENIRVGDKVPKGYILKQFEEAFARYLPSEWASEPLHRYKADETGTSEHFQTATKESDVADWKCEKPNNDGHCSVVADGKGGNGQNVRSPLGNEPGLSLRTIRELADAYQERTYAQYQESGSTDVDHRPLDAWLRRQLAELGVFPEFVEIEFKRVMDVVFAI